MRLPKPLLRRNFKLSKKDFGHALIIAGSPSMLGASVLCSLSAMRAGAGLVTVGVAKGLNLTFQKKVSAVAMSWPLPQTSKGNLSFKAFDLIKKSFGKYQALALGPGLGLEPSTQKLVMALIEHYPKAMVIDADALNALSENPALLLRAKGSRVLTPHAGEMARLIGLSIKKVESNRHQVACDFSCNYRCIVLLKGHRSLVAAPGMRVYENKTGNVALAKAGSGDVLTGIITALLAQGVSPYEAACSGAYLHGLCADHLLKKMPKASVMALDLIEALPKVLLRLR